MRGAHLEGSLCSIQYVSGLTSLEPRGKLISRLIERVCKAGAPSQVNLAAQPKGRYLLEGGMAGGCDGPELEASPCWAAAVAAFGIGYPAKAEIRLNEISKEMSSNIEITGENLLLSPRRRS